MRKLNKKKKWLNKGENSLKTKECKCLNNLRIWKVKEKRLSQKGKFCMKGWRKFSNFKDYKECIKHNCKGFESKKIQEKKSTRKKKRKIEKWKVKNIRKNNGKILTKTLKMTTKTKIYDQIWHVFVNWVKLFYVEVLWISSSPSGSFEFSSFCSYPGSSMGPSLTRIKTKVPLCFSVSWASE